MHTVIIWSAYIAISGLIIFLGYKAISRSIGSTSKPRGLPKTPIKSTESKTGLGVEIFKEGSGEPAKRGDTLTVHYTARLVDGKEVDSSYQRGRPLVFKLGNRDVIDGWEEGLKGMKAGEARIIKVPASLAYGKKGSNKIPPGATVYFELDLLEIDPC